MARSKAHRSLAALPILVVAVALAACTATPEDGKDAAADDAAAKRFVTCLTDEGQTAKILDGGQVGLLLPDAPQDETGAGTLLDAAGGDSMVMVFMDDDGQWMASTTADGYPEDGGMREAWMTCEEQVPEFDQPEPDISAVEGANIETFSLADQMEASLAFAACARKNGYADFADPDADGMLELPRGITEDEARSLLDACSDALGDAFPMVSPKSLESLDFDWFAVAGEYFDGGFSVSSIGPTEDQE